MREINTLVSHLIGTREVHISMDLLAILQFLVLVCLRVGTAQSKVNEINIWSCIVSANSWRKERTLHLCFHSQKLRLSAWSDHNIVRFDVAMEVSYFMHSLKRLNLEWDDEIYIRTSYIPIKATNFSLNVFESLSFRFMSSQSE
jgi:hypothetical protein